MRKIRSAVRSQRKKLKCVRDCSRYENAPTGDEWNHVRYARQKVLLVPRKRFFHTLLPAQSFIRDYGQLWPSRIQNGNWKDVAFIELTYSHPKAMFDG